ncbi:uncharacterized protein BDZ99DRAFT_446597 [Mytilinidion resinicola]|uniref:DUF676 domain-containing protein n=1 Tax=Mytilinidion resinicola TaxID=574789 RepID=A0A6A6YFZ9_9PEZI|nr:uncharacterized protein BDZ99DRAFT_446597 [Mytilinidion resinicola]KAF2807746.1 hypothetical protein BDZ99DRAFT_446597 [Mytilinidion resinicola]
MVRLVTDDDIGLKVLREAPAEAAQIIDIVAIHGIGAHPDESWCKNVGTPESAQWVNWLNKDDMLPAVAPNARIMRYGYQSQWFGEGAMRQKASTVARRLLLALKRKREEFPFRPLIFIAHCFGGLVMLAAARREYQEDEVQTDVLKILELGNEFLHEVVDQFGKTRMRANKAQVACFYELKASNVGKIVGREDRTVGLQRTVHLTKVDCICRDSW